MTSTPAAPAAGRTPVRSRATFGGAVVLGLLLASHARAQEILSPPPEHTECPDGHISTIFIDNHSVFDLTDPDRSRRFDWAFRLANRLHVRTREEVIERELVFAVGDCYDPELLRESERVLRASSFIAEVDIFGIRQADESYHVIVDTRDEWSTRIEPRTGTGTGLQLTGISLREDNLLGTGRQASIFYRRAEEERAYGFSYLDPQLLGTRWQAGLSAGKTPTGSFFRESVEYPFVGETGRSAFRHHIQHHDRYFGYVAEVADGMVEVLLPERRRSFDIGAARRIGQRGRLTLLGALISGDWTWYPREPLLTNGNGATPDPLVDSMAVPIQASVDSIADVRAVFLIGQRNVYYLRRRGLDTVDGTEDVRLGVELELGLGRTIGAFSSQNDLSLDLGLFAASQLGGALVGTRFFAEGRRDYDAGPGEPEWDDVFSQLDLWSYWRASPRHVVVATLAASGGWNTRVPFQLTLGGATGLRGQPHHLAPGARRVIGTVEARSYLGWPYPQLFDLGSVVFVDAGRIWAGDVPFGTNTGVHANLGVGLRAAFPPGSHNTFRLDVAAPLARGFRPSNLVFTLGVGQAVGRAPRFDRELYRSARRGTATSIFSVRSDSEQ